MTRDPLLALPEATQTIRVALRRDDMAYFMAIARAQNQSVPTLLRSILEAVAHDDQHAETPTT